MAPRREAVSAAAVALTAMVAILGTEPNARYLYPALPLLFVPLAAVLGWAAVHQLVLARALVGIAVATGGLNVYFLPASSYYHKDFYGPFTDAQREAYLGVTAPIRVVIAWFNRAHPGAAVLLTQDSYIAGLEGDVYENHWHQYNTLAALRSAVTIEDARRTLERWKVRYLIARKPTMTQYARPLALRELLDQCTTAEYAFREFFVARLDPVCHTAAAAPLDPVLTVTPGDYDDLDPAIMLRGDWERSDQFAEAMNHTVSFTDIAGAEVRFAFQGRELEYVFTKAPNRGIAAVTIDGVNQGDVDLYSAKVEWQSRVRFADLGPGRHVAVIRVTGKSGAGATGKFVDVDGFVVR